MTIRFVVCSAAVLAMFSTSNAATVDFEDLSLAPASYWKGPYPLGVDQPTPWMTSERVGSFTSGGATFNNVYDLSFGSWGAGPTRIPPMLLLLVSWAASSSTNRAPTIRTTWPTAPGTTRPTTAWHSALSRRFGDRLPPGMQPVSMRVTNTTYAALIMLDGDANNFAKKFGDDKSTPGIVETDFPDWFLLKVIGLDASDQQTGSVDFYLADYRFDNDYVIDAWTDVNLSPLGNATKITFALSSSDNGAFGMNTPAYFAMDNLVMQPVPEPAAWLLAAFCIGLGIKRHRRPLAV